MRVAITSVRAPFVQGGAESHAKGLLEALREVGCEADLVTAPFRFSPTKEVWRSMKYWEGKDFRRFDFNEVDAVICLKFPTYYLDHPCKVLWLLHQHRAVYDLWNPLERDGHRWSWRDRWLRRRIHKMDRAYIGKIRRRYANSANVARRLKQYNDLDSEPLYHPPSFSPAPGPYEPFLFCPSRLEPLKRQGLLLDAISRTKSNLRVVFAGEGSEEAILREKTVKAGLSDRVEWLGCVSDTEMLDLYSQCLCVFFGPFDEDYGYVTLEAMHAAKPVITCSDSGGPLEFVLDGETGFVTSPQADAVADAIDRLASTAGLARKFGDAGRSLYESLGLSWRKVVETLVDLES
jgi:glycosyltransferase involved in cell wall biosynthesis